MTGSCAFRQDVAGYPALRLCQNWWNAQDVVGDYSVDEVILGMASQLAEAQDHVVISDLRGPDLLLILLLLSSFITNLSSRLSLRPHALLPP